MKRIARLRRTAAILTLATTALAFTASGQLDLLKLAWAQADPAAIAAFRLRHASRENFIEHIGTAVKEQDFDDARRLVRLAGENGHSLPPELVAATTPGPVESTWLTMRDFARGAATGDVDSLASLGGTMAADYLVVGDLRDVATQGSRLARGEDYDGLTLGLSMLGLITLLPGTGPADLGLSLVKTANRTSKLAAPLRHHLAGLAADLLDTQALKRLWPGEGRILRADPALLRATLIPAIRPQAAARIGALAGETAGLVRAGGVKTALRSLEHVEDVTTDLPRFTRFARGMGKDGSAVLRLLGKQAILLGKLARALAAALLTLAFWCLALAWTLASTARSLGRLLVRTGVKPA